MTLREEINKTKHWIMHNDPHDVHTPILTITRLSVYYERSSALEDISFEVKAGERLAVVGPNGAGKSTLFKVIAGMLTPTEGQVHVYGHEPRGHTCIAYVPQRNQVDWNFPVTVADVVMMGRIGKLGLFRNPRGKDWKIARHSLEVVGMAHLSGRQISQLSGGQQQRMFIARALAQEAELMLMDEPLTGLDATSQGDIFSLLDELQRQGVTVMVTMHDLNMASERFNRVMLLNRHLLGLGSPQDVFKPEKLIAAYGGHLQLLSTEEGTLALGDTCCDEGEPHP